VEGDSIFEDVYWWNTDGKVRYPQATSILLLCDGGGSNSSRYYIFKQDLQALGLL